MWSLGTGSSCGPTNSCRNFAQKVNGRYDLDHDDVVARMKAYVDRGDHVRAVRTAGLDVLRAHGFGEEAARKWP
jgi:hypothetical protein